MSNTTPSLYVYDGDENSAKANRAAAGKGPLETIVINDLPTIPGFLKGVPTLVVGRNIFTGTQCLQQLASMEEEKKKKTENEEPEKITDDMLKAYLARRKKMN